MNERIFTGAYTHIDAEIYEWDTDNFRYWELSGIPRNLSDHDERCIVDHIMNHYVAEPYRHNVRRARTFKRRN